MEKLSMEKEESRREQEELGVVPLSSVAKSKKKRKRLQKNKKNLENSSSPKKPVEKLSMEEEGTRDEKEDLVSCPDVLAAGKQDSDSETETEKIASIAKSEKKKEAQSSSAAVASPETKKEKRPVEDGSPRDVPLSSVAKPKKKRNRSKKSKKNLENSPPAKKDTQPVEQLQRAEVEDLLMEEEETRDHEQEDLVPCPDVLAAGKQDSGSDTETEKIASIAKSEKKKEAQSSSAAVASPETKMKEKRRVEDGSPSDVSPKRVKTEEKKEAQSSSAAVGSPKTETKEKPPVEEETETEMEAQSSSAAVASPKTETKEKPTVEEGSPRDVSPKHVKTEEKKTIFKRLWSHEDEIVLLQAVLDFKTDPLKDKVRFEESVEKSSISIEFTNDQLMSKIRSLKRKFKSKENKEVLNFSNPLDRTCFDMSQKIWGSKVEEEDEEEEEEEEDRKNVVMVNGEDDWFGQSFLVGKVASFGLGEEGVKQCWKLVPIERKRKLEEKWRLLEENRIKFVLSQIDLVHDASSAIAETTR